MSEDNFQHVFNEFLLSIVNEHNATLIQEIRYRWKEYLNQPVIEAPNTSVKEILFTTSDNVAIYEDSDAWVVSNSFDIHCVCACKSWYEKTKQHFKAYFSTQQAAKEYILLNKPVICLQDIYDHFKKYMGYGDGVAINKLKELAKSKIQ